MTAKVPDTSFLRDVKTLRAQAKKSLKDGAVTEGYIAVEKSIELLQFALATEIVCVLRYTMNSISVAGITSKSVAAEFAEHANDEREHMMLIANRIDELGGDPNFDPKDLASRSATEYGAVERWSRWSNKISLRNASRSSITAT